MRGVRYGSSDCVDVELPDDSEGASDLVSESPTIIRASSMTSGSSSVIPFSISANIAINSLNSVSVIACVENLAYSYCARNLGPRFGGLMRPYDAN